MKRYKSLFPAVALVVALLGWACGGADTITGVDYQTDDLSREQLEIRGECPDEGKSPGFKEPCEGFIDKDK